MRALVYILATLVLTAVGASCTGRRAQTLAVIDRVDSLLDSRPDSALTLLRSIDSSLLTSRELRARHALAMSRALDKNYIDTTDCSIVDVAVDYYSRHSDPRRLMLALFYQGTVLRNARQYNQAVISAMQANEIALQLADDYWTAKTYELLADIHHSSYNRAEVQKNRLLAAYYYNKAGYSINNRYALLDLAVAFSNNKEYDRSLILIDSLISASKTDANRYDSLFVSDCYRYLISSLIHIGNYHLASKEFPNILSFRPYKRYQTDEKIYLSEIKYMTGDKEWARTLIDSLLKTPLSQYEKKIAYTTLYRIQFGDNNQTKAYATLDSIFKWANIEIKDIINQDVYIAQRDFYLKKSDEARLKESEWKFKSITIALSSLFIIILLSVSFLYWRKLKNRDLKGRINEILLLSQSLEQQTLSNAALNQKLNSQTASTAVVKQKLAQLLHEKLTNINQLCSQYISLASTNETKTFLYRKIEKEILNICRLDNLPEIEKEVNTCLDNIIGNLRQQIPDLSAQDINYATLFYAGYSPAAISLFMGVQLRSVYNKRTRLSNRILQTQAPDREYLAKMLFP